MREIKFRAWDITENMTYFSLNPKTMLKGVPEPLKSILKQEEGYNLMQFTGLYSKSGEEIYEGDIVKTRYNNARVDFINGMFGIEKLNSRHGRTFTNHISECEIIGNIYENPELLEGKK